MNADDLFSSFFIIRSMAFLSFLLCVFFVLALSLFNFSLLLLCWKVLFVVVNLEPYFSSGLTHLLYSIHCIIITTFENTGTQ